MKISEKQIMELMAIAQGAMHGMSERGHDEASKFIACLIDTINGQQSEELKEVE